MQISYECSEGQQQTHAKTAEADIGLTTFAQHLQAVQCQQLPSFLLMTVSRRGGNAD